MICGYYEQDQRIHQALYEEFQIDPERVRETQPIVALAFESTSAQRVFALEAQLADAAKKRTAALEIEAGKQQELEEELITERKRNARLLRDAEIWERRALAAEALEHDLAKVSYEPGEQWALKERGWKKGI